jgi:hypothetical protein
MIYKFPERVERVFGAGLPLEMSRRGLRSFSPQEYFRLRDNIDNDLHRKLIPSVNLSVAPRIDSLQPTLAWETFDGRNVTYDLAVWMAGERGPTTLLYKREGLRHPSHRLEVPLNPSSLYYWSGPSEFYNEWE